MVSHRPSPVGMVFLGWIVCFALWGSFADAARAHDPVSVFLATSSTHDRHKLQDLLNGKTKSTTKDRKRRSASRSLSPHGGILPVIMEELQSQAGHAKAKRKHSRDADERPDRSQLEEHFLPSAQAEAEAEAVATQLENNAIEENLDAPEAQSLLDSSVDQASAPGQARDVDAIEAVKTATHTNADKIGALTAQVAAIETVRSVSRSKPNCHLTFSCSCLVL